MAERDEDDDAAPDDGAGPQLFYNETVVDHFMHPRNVGELPAAEGVISAVVGDPSCGDQMKLWIEISAGRIERVRFKSLGCPGAIATSSMLTELAEGRTLEQADALTDDDVIEALGGIPARKRHCSLLGVQALRAALARHREGPSGPSDPTP